jgi:outer membrane immunogenic protein
MKKLVLAGAMALAMAGIAQAADLPLKAPPPAPVYSWTGWYLGVNLGDSWSSSNSTTFSGSPFTDPFFAANIFPTTLSTNPHGFAGGLQTGYNWQLSSAWVIGAETDIQISRYQSSATVTPVPTVPFPPVTTQAIQQSTWFGTLRARLGFLLTPTVLLYGTGGLAYGQADTSFNTEFAGTTCGPFTCITGDNSSIRTGWAGGGGIEWMLAPHWTLRAEYLYLDLGSNSVTATSPFTTPFAFTASSTFHENIARAALNFGF